MDRSLPSDERREQLTRVLTWVLALALLAALLGVVYVAVTPQELTEPYTEFYVLGTGGNASGYPTNLSVGETGEITVGITNHEHREMQYTVVLALENRTVAKRTVTVADEQTWEDTFSFTPESAGRQKLRILLYVGKSANPSAEPYRRLRLWVTVSD